MNEMALTCSSASIALHSSEPVRAAVQASRLPSLDGWRSVSILLVLGAHTMHTKGFPQAHEAVFKHAFDGHLGVRFFFVLSGFLITWLMLKEEQQKGAVNLRHFYLRRAFRILPVYAAFILVLAALQWWTPFQQSTLAWVGNLTFTSNYFHGSQSSNHLWSLAVEEQFYLLWPAVFVWRRPQRDWRLCLLILGSACGLAVFNRLAWSHPFSESELVRGLFHEWSFFNNADSLAIGCMAAIALWRDRERVSEWITGRRWLSWMVGGLLLSAPWLFQALAHWLPAAQKICWLLDFGAGRTLQSFGFAVLMLQSLLLPSWAFYAVLNTQVLSHFGVLSYSIYIWQQLFCTPAMALGVQDAWWISYPFWFVPALLVAWISYYGLERPLLQLRHRFR